MTQATPVRYMVVGSLFGMKYYVLDTSSEGNGRRVASCDKLGDAHRVAEALEKVFPLNYEEDEFNRQINAIYGR